MNALLAWYFVAVWGAGYIATKIGLQYAAPFTFLTLRFAFGLACLFPIIFIWKPVWPRNRVELGHLAVAVLLMHAVQLGGSHYAQYLGTSAGVAALIISCQPLLDRKSTRLNSSHLVISYAVFCLKKKKKRLSKHDDRRDHYTHTQL